MKFRSFVALSTPVPAAAVVIVARARNQNERAPFWPAITINQIVNEWYSTVPRHQRLGTFAGNRIDESPIMPGDSSNYRGTP